MLHDLSDNNYSFTIPLSRVYLRISSQELKEGGLRKEHNIGTYKYFKGIAVSLGPSGGYNCYPGRGDLFLADIYHDSSHSVESLIYSTVFKLLNCKTRIISVFNMFLN